MGHIVAFFALAAASLAGLVLVALGLPGLWLIVVVVAGYAVLTGFHSIGWAVVGIVLGLALLGELFELWLGYGLARRYGGSHRAGWGALLGGLAGAMVGVPIPVVGSVVGSLLGSFAGAALLEYTRAPDGALRAGWGALLGRVAATSAKMVVGVVITVVALYALARG